jgi:hypothetical protein
MPSASGIRAGKAYVEISANADKLQKGLRAAEAKLKAFGASITSIGTKLAGLGAATVTPLVASAKVFADMGSDMLDASQRIGASVEVLSELGYAAEQSGADFATLENGMRRMQRTIGDAVDGTQTATDALGKLGLTVADLQGLSPDEQFKLMADRLSQIQDPTLRAAAAMEVFGRSGTMLLPMMQSGARGIEELQREARALGVSMSTEDATAAEAFGDALSAMWKVVKQSAFAIGAALAPSLKQAAEAFTKTVAAIIKWIGENRELVAWVFKIAVAVTGAGVALVAIGAAITGVGALFGMLASAVGVAMSAFAGIGTVIGALLSPIGLVAAGLVGLAGYFAYSTGAAGKALTWLSGVFGKLKDDALGTFEGISDALAAGDIALAAKVLWSMLKMEWAAGINWLNEKWIGFKEYFIEIGTSAVYGLAKVMTNAWAGMQSTWNEVTSGFLTAWELFATGAVDLWKGAQNLISKGILYLTGLLDSSFDVEGAVSALDDQYNREKDRRANAGRERVQQIEDDRQKRQEEIEQNRQGAIGELNAEQNRNREARQKKYQEELAQGQAAVDAARKEWEAARGEARKKREAVVGSDDPSSPDYKPGGIEDALDQTQRKSEVAGTFNPLVAAMLGGDSLAERAAKAGEQVAANTKKLVQQAQHGGLVFS